MKVIRTIAIGFTGASLVLSASGIAMAEERSCRGTIGSQTVDNLKVPSDARCVLDGTKVEGTINVGRNAILIARDVRVIGNVQGENAQKVVVRGGSRIGGSIQIVQGKSALVRNSKVNADILFDEQNREVRALGNTVGGNIQAFQNTGGVVIKGNEVDGNLQCKQNHPAPTGGNNRVEGSKEDQCSSL